MRFYGTVVAAYMYIFTNFYVRAKCVSLICNLVGMVDVYEDILLVFLQLQLSPLLIFRDLVAPRRSRSLLVANDDDDDDGGVPPTCLQQ